MIAKAGFLETLRQTLSGLMPLKIGKHGQIMEWSEDFDEAEPGHRHMSQLYDLYPAAEITSSTPELFEAAKKTIERRLKSGGAHTGWSRAWVINFYAWRDGSFEGLMARGGFKVSAEWKDGRIIHCSVKYTGNDRDNL